MPSSVIRKHAYNAETETLSIWFVPSGKRYDYFDVPPELYEAFRLALSKGRFFNIRIRDHFRSREVDEADEA
jgi:hypothetical protein